ncbi:MAG: alpha/beta hydrolase [Actinobacteria bacterium]|nr:alpha/beta hydrolase [Actinomycetota bacterium]
MTVWSAEAGHADDPLIVLVHGAMDRSASMLKLSRRLDDEYRVARYDRRGYGQSTPHRGPFDMPSQVHDLVGLLAGRRAVLVGHSYGGNVALAVAASQPALVAGVVVYEAPLSWEPWWPGATAGAAAISAAARPDDAAEAFMRRLIGDQRWLALPERTRSTRRSEGVPLVNELADLRSNRPWLAADVRVPVNVGYGTLARDHHRTGMAHLAETLVDAQLVCLAGCGHAAPTTAPDQFRRELIAPLLQRAGPPWARAGAHV